MAAIVVVVIAATNKPVANGAFTLLFSGVVYVGFGAVMAKLGYARKSLAQMRADAAATPRARARTAPVAASTRPRPAPTKRTSSGTNRPPKKRR